MSESIDFQFSPLAVAQHTELYQRVAVNNLGKISIAFELDESRPSNLLDVLTVELENTLGYATIQEIADHDPRAAYTVLGYTLNECQDFEAGKMHTGLPNPDTNEVEVILTAKRKSGLWHFVPGRLGLRTVQLARFDVGPNDHATMQQRVKDHQPQ